MSYVSALIITELHQEIPALNGYRPQRADLHLALYRHTKKKPFILITAAASLTRFKKNNWIHRGEIGAPPEQRASFSMKHEGFDRNESSSAPVSPTRGRRGHICRVWGHQLRWGPVACLAIMHFPNSQYKRSTRGYGGGGHIQDVNSAGPLEMMSRWLRTDAT